MKIDKKDYEEYKKKREELIESISYYIKKPYS